MLFQLPHDRILRRFLGLELLPRFRQDAQGAAEAGRWRRRLLRSRSAFVAVTAGALSALCRSGEHRLLGRGSICWHGLQPKQLRHRVTSIVALVADHFLDTNLEHPMDNRSLLRRTTILQRSRLRDLRRQGVALLIHEVQLDLGVTRALLQAPVDALVVQQILGDCIEDDTDAEPLELNLP